jgi:hypothetical protein
MSIWLIGGLFLAYRLYGVYKQRRSGTPPAGNRPPQSLIIILNVLSVITGFVYLFSFNYSIRFFSNLSAIASSLLVVYTNYGLPAVSRQSIKLPLMHWVQRAMAGAEFPFLFFCLMFLNPSAPVVDYAVTIVMLRRSIWQLGAHGTKAWAGTRLWEGFGKRGWMVCKSYENQILNFSTNLEIVIGFIFIVLLFTPMRQIVTLFVYWTFLRLKYQLPRSRASHSTAWGSIDQLTRGVRERVPFIGKFVDYGVKWFNQSQ